MKKIFLICISVFITAHTYAADYSDGRRKKDNTWLRLNLYEAINQANPIGAAYDQLYLETEGGGRSGFLDYYFLADIFDLLDIGQHSVTPGQYFLKFQPRFSIDGISKENLSIGPVKEWYLATRVLGGNNWEQYFIGPGADLDTPFFQLLGFNLFTMFEHVNGTHIDYAGFVAALTWYAELYQFKSNKAVLSYQGWMDWGFGNKQSERDNVNGSKIQFQMHNSLYYTYANHYSLVLSVKFHDDLGYLDQESSDATTIFLGVSYQL